MMLQDWLKNQLGGEIPPGLLLVGFVAEADEEAALKALIHAAGEAVPEILFIRVPQEKKLAAASEVSRTPTLLFTAGGRELARIYRPGSPEQLKAALAAVRAGLHD